MNSSELNKRIVRVVVYSLVGLVVLFGGIFLFAPRVNYQDPDRLKVFGAEPFEREKWLAADPAGRARMIHDLARKRPYLDMGYEEAKAFLGNPTDYYLHDINLAYLVTRFGRPFTFVVVWNPRTKRYDSFWIEPFPEEAFPES